MTDLMSIAALLLVVSGIAGCGSGPSASPEADGDGDGVPDLHDVCPFDPENRNGWEDDDGCIDTPPDTDGDGVLDGMDRCPVDAEDPDGYEDDDGCPDPDNDLDGTLDRLDACPNDPEDADGFEDADGCPDVDNDGDGVPDRADRCPFHTETDADQPGADGCPDISILKCSDTAAAGFQMPDIRFEPGTAQIEPESLKHLDGLSHAFRQTPSMRAALIGHAEAHGSAAQRLAMSERRAAAVHTALRARLVDPNQLATRGAGSAEPLDDAPDADGHASNERVQILVTAYDCDRTPADKTYFDPDGDGIINRR